MTSFASTCKPLFSSWNFREWSFQKDVRNASSAAANKSSNPKKPQRATTTNDRNQRIHQTSSSSPHGQTARASKICCSSSSDEHLVFHHSSFHRISKPSAFSSRVQYNCLSIFRKCANEEASMVRHLILFNLPPFSCLELTLVYFFTSKTGGKTEDELAAKRSMMVECSMWQQI